MGWSSTFDSWKYLSPYKMGSDIPGGVMLMLNSWPEIGGKIIIINFKRHIFLGFQFICKFLFLLILSQLNLSQILMLKLFFIWIVQLFLYFFFNMIIFLLILCIWTSMVILDHHYTFSFVMPCCLRFFFLLLIVFADEKGFFQSPIQHHNETFNGKETWVILLVEIVQWSIFFHFLL